MPYLYVSHLDKYQMRDDFHVDTDISALPACEHEAYLEEGFCGMCTGGTAVIKVFSVSRTITENDLVTVLPLQLVSIHDVSADFSMTFFKVDRGVFLDVMSGLGKITPDFFFYMRKNFRMRLDGQEAARFLGFCRVLDFRCKNDDSVFRRETVLHLLRIYFWDFYVHFRKISCDRKTLRILNSNKESIAFRFAMLVFEHHREHREIAFYADKLCISPLYLTKVIQEVNGQSAREFIADYVVVAIKSLLLDANLDIKDVVRQTGFSNHSSLSRFFRQHTGMSPSEYRRTVHITW